MEIPAKYTAKFLEGPTKEQLTEYGFLCGTSAKLVGMTYFAQHKRIERLFPNEHIDFVLKTLNTWLHESEKSSINHGMAFNARMKQYKEAKSKSL